MCHFGAEDCRGVITMSSSNNDALSHTWRAIMEDHQDLVYKLKGCPIPGVSMGITELPSRDVYNLKTHGDKLEYENISLEFIIDEDWSNYINLFEWLKASASTKEMDTRDFTVQLLNNVNKLFKEFLFEDCFPVNLSTVDMTVVDNESVLSSTIELAYLRWDFLTNIKY